MKNKKNNAGIPLIFLHLPQRHNLNITSVILLLGISPLTDVPEQDGCNVEIIDMDHLTRLGFPRDALRAALRRLHPYIVWITYTTPAVLRVLKISGEVTAWDPATYVIAGGPRPSALPGSLSGLSRDIDVAVFGEGE